MRDYVGRMEKLFAAGAISKVDLHRVYAGAFLTFYTYFERAIERAFVGLVMGRYVSSDPRVRSMIEVKSDRVAHAVIRGSAGYVDWLPYDRHTRKRAHAFLSRGLPFSALTKPQRKVLDRISIVRNALAHESSHSLRLFDSEFVAGKSLPPEQRRPAGYLRGHHAAAQSRYEFHLSEVVAVARGFMS